MESGPRGLLISPIKDGTVIDHIRAGAALTVLRMLGITGQTDEELSIATNVTSMTGGQEGRKDIVKVSNRELSKEEVDRIALISPHATINIIRDYIVVEKKGVETPKLLYGIVRCTNAGCITNANEPIQSAFEVTEDGLHCLYCDTVITTDLENHII
ncbi:aspartate carbamoyltransferase regulatory subunit [Methanogenium sp. S4BF]|uniref:aspartate carbamoyltransferase regulatory subunit n=1 Tax=Methanogenium sp. S4BF TaxID=1789226 RepID=UPI002415A686|nr:aspartate carbamoyltransferase regulatory subunit [Methanogenium sp. S4BF]WFN35539.1 aspartate carbamoyltransferase regulatory subunit [Methanogenium sp. S4BF]